MLHNYSWKSHTKISPNFLWKVPTRKPSATGQFCVICIEDGSGDTVVISFVWNYFHISDTNKMFSIQNWGFSTTPRYLNLRIRRSFFCLEQLEQRLLLIVNYMTLPLLFLKLLIHIFKTSSTSQTPSFHLDRLEQDWILLNLIEVGRLCLV